MSEVKIHRVRHKLAAKLRTSANLSVTTALRSAKDRVAVLEPRIVAVIDAELARLEGLAQRLAEDDRAALAMAYDCADRLVGLAAAAPRLERFAKAALGLCDWLEALRGAPPQDTRVIKVHVAGLRMLAAEGAEREQEAVVQELARLRVHIQARR